MQNKILEAVIASLRTTGVVKDGNVVTLGTVNTYFKKHISNKTLLNELSGYIKDGYFKIDDPWIRVTEFGIQALEINKKLN